MIVAELTDKELRIEYRDLMKNALEMNNGAKGWDGALETLKSVGTAHSKEVLAEMSRRELPGIAHEDGRFDYLCGSQWCRCGS